MILWYIVFWMPHYFGLIAFFARTEWKIINNARETFWALLLE